MGVVSRNLCEACFWDRCKALDLSGSKHLEMIVRFLNSLFEHIRAPTVSLWLQALNGRSTRVGVFIRSNGSGVNKCNTDPPFTRPEKQDDS